VSVKELPDSRGKLKARTWDGKTECEGETKAHIYTHTRIHDALSFIELPLMRPHTENLT